MAKFHKVPAVQGQNLRLHLQEKNCNQCSREDFQVGATRRHELPSSLEEHHVHTDTRGYGQADGVEGQNANSPHSASIRLQVEVQLVPQIPD
ncbi:hypothetical protein GN956_G16718 [Arapaima gigas]